MRRHSIIGNIHSCDHDMCQDKIKNEKERKIICGMLLALQNQIESLS